MLPSPDFQKLDFIVCTIDVSSALPLTDLTSCLWGESTTEVFTDSFRQVLTILRNLSLSVRSFFSSTHAVNGTLHIVRQSSFRASYHVPALTEGASLQVAMPDDELAPFQTQALAANGAKLGVSHIGAKVEAEEMYRLAAEKGVRVWKEVIPMKDVAKAVQGVKNNEVRCKRHPALSPMSQGLIADIRMAL